jgi:hypothetical protein
MGPLRDLHVIMDAMGTELQWHHDADGGSGCAKGAEMEGRYTNEYTVEYAQQLARLVTTQQRKIEADA